MADFDLEGIGMTSRRTRERLVDRIAAQGIYDSAVLDRMRAVPRHIFVDEALAQRSYEDTALPIGHGQTISQPFIVALMTQLIREGGGRSVLEVGMGCGYQSAVLSGLFEKVWSVELLAPLAARAQERLQALGIKNVRYKVGDGYQGWSVHAPFDCIIVTAAPASIPDALVEQLAIGGRMVIPVGGSGQQELLLIKKDRDGITQTVEEIVRFVPLVKGA
ncbi:MAG: protein-L-isoaspartate(D-aspartate) O-methyltransferase [Pseudomonadales bacterium]|nr:protein-L-isoaspartate(D-aspartate) O-methyltransferase [Pseudomonadales bacterium]